MREDELQALFLQEDSYCAHINPKTGEKQNIKTHLHNVAYLAQKKLSIGNFEDNVPDERSNT